MVWFWTPTRYLFGSINQLPQVEALAIDIVPNITLD